MKRAEFIKEISGLSTEELRERARGLGEAMMKLRFRGSSGQLEHPHHMREARRNLARILTVINKKEAASKPS